MGKDLSTHQNLLGGFAADVMQRAQNKTSLCLTQLTGILNRGCSALTGVKLCGWTADLHLLI